MGEVWREMRQDLHQLYHGLQPWHRLLPYRGQEDGLIAGAGGLDAARPHQSEQLLNRYWLDLH